MGLKIYEIDRLTYLSTDVKVDGKLLPVIFEGGTKNNPTKIRARFITENEGIQKEIEKRKDFNKEIFCVFEEKPEVEPVPEPVVIPEGFEEVKGITTGVEAKEYILEKFPEVKHAELKSNAAIKEVAAKYKVIFSELN